MTFTLPAPKDIRDLFEDLLGRSVTVAPADPVLSADIRTSLVALYVDDTLQLSAVIGMDLRLAVFAGAAIGLIPVGGAEACIEDKVMSPMISENITEICNIMSSLLNQEGAPHLRMYQTFLPGETPPSDAVGYLLALGRRLDLAVNVAGYGTGKLSVAFTA